MYGYHYRLLDRLDRPVASIAVLTDDRATWRPRRFSSELWGRGVEFHFPVVKLLNYRARQAELERNPNPFAVVVLAHLAHLETRHDATRRGQMKLALVRRLHERGHARQDIIDRYRFIDWLLRLPAELEAAVWQEVRAYEEARAMPYITSAERIGIQKGLEQGREEGLQEGIREGLLKSLEQVIELKFGPAGHRLREAARRIEETTVLEGLVARVWAARAPDEVLASLADTDADTAPEA
jgi:hypothetical protein